MNTKNNSVIISGSTAGIGLELAKLSVAYGNKVIIKKQKFKGGFCIFDTCAFKTEYRPFI
jgi:hypothetical protein